MNLKKSVLLSAGALVLASSFSTSALAAATEGLSACKSQIANDAQMSGYDRVEARMDTMKRRGRYIYFTLDVSGKSADADSEAWTADCKARSSGRVEELELVRVGGNSEQQVAQTDS